MLLLCLLQHDSADGFGGHTPSCSQNVYMQLMGLVALCGNTVTIGVP